MKRTLQIILALALVSMFLTSPVAAASAEGLDWGVAVDDEFTYRFAMDDPFENITLDEGINVTVEAVPTMPGAVGDWDDIPVVDVDIVYTNGTSPGFELFIIIGIIYAGGLFAVPIGNFSHLGILLNGSTYWSENSTLINTSSEWGSSYFDVDDEMRLDLRTTYLKSDGMLARYTYDVENTTSGETGSASLIRDGLGFDIMGWIQDNILIVGIGVGVIVLIAAVVCVKRR
ncbi:hypothetical protein EU524_00575 [Candidatus Thorarchaeota archaeon]|nr:MAG: hypothetical protein EU524_00575 [Candidatus Thorarchaeota archaeon]